MGAVAGAVLGTPISTILIVFELTGSYEVTSVVMVAMAVAVAAVVISQVDHRSFFICSFVSAFSICRKVAESVRYGMSASPR